MRVVPGASEAAGALILVADPEWCSNSRKQCGRIEAFCAKDGRPVGIWSLPEGEAAADAFDVDAQGRYLYVGARHANSDKPGTGKLFRIAMDQSTSEPIVFSLGQLAEENLGASVAVISDVNGDGVRDIAVGTPGLNGKNGERGGVRIVSGKNGDTLQLLKGQVGGVVGYLVQRVDTAPSRSLLAYGLSTKPPISVGWYSEISTPWALRSDSLDKIGNFVLWSSCAACLKDGPGLLIGVYVPCGSLGNLDHDKERNVVCYAASGKIIHEFREQEHGSYYGKGVYAGADIDGDGVNDIIIGSPGLGGVDCLGGFTIYSGTDYKKIADYVGERSGLFCGTQVDASVDVDGDGKNDIVVSCVNPFTSNDVRGGEVRIVSGRDYKTIVRTITEVDTVPR